MIFGIQAPKFVFGSATVLLYNAVYGDEKSDSIFVEHESQIDAQREESLKGVHVELPVTIYLFQYGGSAAAKYYEIMQYFGKTLDAFYKHMDGKSYKTITGANARFIMKEFSRSYLETANWKDGLTIIFRSLDPIDVSATATTGLHIASEVLVSTKFTINLKISTGDPIYDGLVELIPHGETYPTDSVPLTSGYDGTWFTDIVPDGYYDLYYGGIICSAYENIQILNNALQP